MTKSLADENGRRVRVLLRTRYRLIQEERSAAVHPMNLLPDDGAGGGAFSNSDDDDKPTFDGVKRRRGRERARHSSGRRDGAHIQAEVEDDVVAAAVANVADLSAPGAEIELPPLDGKDDPSKPLVRTKVVDVPALNLGTTPMDPFKATEPTDSRRLSQFSGTGGGLGSGRRGSMTRCGKGVHHFLLLSCDVCVGMLCGSARGSLPIKMQEYSQSEADMMAAESSPQDVGLRGVVPSCFDACAAHPRASCRARLRPSCYRTQTRKRSSFCPFETRFDCACIALSTISLTCVSRCFPRGC
jgi:hypothetical protein